MRHRIESWEDLDSMAAMSFPGLRPTRLAEWTDIVRLLRFDLGLEPPLDLRHRERPDFELLQVGGDREIGIEHTRAAHQGWEESERHLGDAVFPAFQVMSRNWFEGEKACGKSLGRRIVERQADSWIWGAREQAHAKAEEIRNAIRKKSIDSTKPGFESHKENWLLISDRCPFLYLELVDFQERLIAEDLLAEPVYSRILFMTRVKCRERGTTADILYDLSDRGFLPIEVHA